MPYRIAIATSTGKFIDMHFGHADHFLIVDVDENGYAVVETRQADRACQNFQHETSSFDAIINLLKDCEGVFVSRIGPAAGQYVVSHGLRVFEAPYCIEDVLKKLVSEQILSKNQTTGRQTDRQSAAEPTAEGDSNEHSSRSWKAAQQALPSPMAWQPSLRR